MSHSLVMFKDLDIIGVGLVAIVSAGVEGFCASQFGVKPYCLLVTGLKRWVQPRLLCFFLLCIYYLVAMFHTSRYGIRLN